MRHYDTVMRGSGCSYLARVSLRFPAPLVTVAIARSIRDIFEDFVRGKPLPTAPAALAGCATRTPMSNLARDSSGKPVFRLKPDIALMKRGQVRFILDAKWKRLASTEPNHGISQADAYQLFAYGMRYGCRRVVLLYPKTMMFRKSLRLRFVNDDLTLDCFPFDVSDPEESVSALMRDIMG